MSPVDIDDWRARIAEERGALADVAGTGTATARVGRISPAWASPGGLASAFVTPGFFTTLGVEAQAGRLPRDEEMVRGSDDKLVVLSDPFWRSAFGAAESAVGSSLTLDNVSYRIVGVMPPRHRISVGAGRGVHPAVSPAPPKQPLDRSDRAARPGATVEQGRAQLNAITRQLAEVFPAERSAMERGDRDPASRRDRGTGTDRAPRFRRRHAGAADHLRQPGEPGVARGWCATGSSPSAPRSARAGPRDPQLLTESIVLALLGGALGPVSRTSGPGCSSA